MAKKHIKYSQEHFDELKKLITKTEKVDQIDKLVIDKLKDERDKLVSDCDFRKTSIKEAEDKVIELENKLENKEKWEKFIGDGTGTNEWNTKGWSQSAQTWLQGSTNGNICKATVNGSTIEITEDEAIYLLTRVVKAFKGIGENDFRNWESTSTRGSVAHAEALAALIRLHKQADYMVKNKSFGRDGWEVGWNHTNSANKTPLIDTNIDWKDVKLVANFITHDPEDDNSKNLDQSNFKEEINWSIYKKGDQYTAKELKDYVSKETISNATHYYKNGYQKGVSDWKTNNRVEVKVKTIQDWANLAKCLDNTVIDSLQANDNTGPTTNLYQKLFSDIREVDKDNPYFGTNQYTLDSIIESVVKSQQVIQAQRAALLTIEKDKVAANITKKEGEIQTLITDQITELRTSLSTHKLDQGFKDDNRKTSVELITIFKQLKDIRYLENCDEEAPSSESKENKAYEELKTLLTDWEASNVKLFPNLEGATEADKVKKIKATTNNLITYKNDYEKWDKLIKFSDKQKAELKAIKVGLGENEDPTDTLKTYQAKLKALDPLLTETVITQAVIEDWKSQNNFKTSDTMEEELKKIFENGALKDSFKTVMTTADAELTDTAKLLTKKKASEVITMIRRWEYDNEEQSEKDKLIKVIKMNMDKKPTDNNPTDEEITTGLYKLAVGEYEMKTASQITTWETSKQNITEKPLWKRYGYSGIWLPILAVAVVGVGLAWACWDKLKKWWEPKELEEDE